MVFKQYLNLRAIGLFFGVFLLLTLTGKRTEAVKPDPKLPGGHLNVSEVLVMDAFDCSGAGTIVIMGEGFLQDEPLVVTLGDFGELTIVGSPTDAMITVNVPCTGGGDPLLNPGDYLLSVSVGLGQSQHDEYDLTISPIQSGAIGLFNLAECPPGWSELTAAQGRAIVGLPEAGTLLGTVGTALGDLEDLEHTHDVDPLSFESGNAGDHTHEVEITTGPPPDSFDIKFEQSFEETFVSSLGTTDEHTHEVSGTTGSAGDHNHPVDVPNTTSTAAHTSDVIPYIQMLVCQKN